MTHTYTIAANKLRKGQRIFDSISHRLVTVKSILKNADESLKVTTEFGDTRISAGFLVRVG